MSATTETGMSRTPQPEDFRVEWDADCTFDFFEDDNADALWAHGSLDSEEFVRQANEYDRLCDAGWDPEGAYTTDDIRSFWAIIRYDRPNDDYWRVHRCEDTIFGAALVKVIDR